MIEIQIIRLTNALCEPRVTVSTTTTENTMDYGIELQRHRHEARRLRAQYSHDRALHAALALDLAIRTVACRMLALGCAVASRLFGSR